MNPVTLSSHQHFRSVEMPIHLHSSGVTSCVIVTSWDVFPLHVIQRGDRKIAGVKMCGSNNAPPSIPTPLHAYVVTPACLCNSAMHYWHERWILPQLTCWHWVFSVLFHMRHRRKVIIDFYIKTLWMALQIEYRQMISSHTYLCHKLSRSTFPYLWRW